MNDYELSKLADMMDEDAVAWCDLDTQALLEQYADGTQSFHDLYFGFYDDIKTNPYEDW